MKVDVGAMSSQKARWIGRWRLLVRRNRGAVVEVVVGRFYWEGSELQKEKCRNLRQSVGEESRQEVGLRPLR